MIEQIRAAVHGAAQDEQKLAMFNFQVLTHAQALANEDPTAFCQAINVPVTYAAEFRKMLALARVMRQQNVAVSAVR